MRPILNVYVRQCIIVCIYFSWQFDTGLLMLLLSNAVHVSMCERAREELVSFPFDSKEG